MAELFHGPRPGNSERSRPASRAHGPEPGVVQHIREIDERVVALRREAVVAVVCQEEIASRLAPVSEETRRIEGKAFVALQGGQERLARQILHRQLGTLALRDALRDELGEARRRTIRLLKDAARLEKRAWQARRAVDAWTPRPSAGPSRDDGLTEPFAR